MSAEGPNLSHWPGNRTPAVWKADLSTGICLNFARAPRAEQLAFLSGTETVLNDHYDTDGFLSLLAVLRPDVILAREAAALAAAATGDYQAFQQPNPLGERGFAVDRIVLHLAKPDSPVAGEFQELSGTAKDHARYRWLIDHAEDVLDHPEGFAALWEEELLLIQSQLAATEETTADHRPELGLAFVRSATPVHRLAVNTRAGTCYRVLHTQSTPDGPLYRFHDRTESWFEVQTFRPAPRVDLGPLLAQLQERETHTDGSWNLDPWNEPVPELYFGVKAPQVYGQITRQLLPSSLQPDDVEGLFAGFFAGCAGESASPGGIRRE